MRIKSRFVLSFNHREEAEQALSIAKGKLGEFCIIEVFNDAPEYLRLTEHLEKNPPNFCHVTEDEVFSKQELLDAPVLRMVPNGHRGYPQPEGGTRNENYLNRSYDLNSGCPGCSRGLLQNRPLRMKSSVTMGKSLDISGIHWLREYIVSRRLKDLIEEAGLTGCEFWPIIKNGKDIPFEDIFQLKITGVMPPMAEQTVFEHDPLLNWGNRCKHGCGAVSIKGRVHYRAADLIDVPDFALTQEWMGVAYEFWRWPFMSHKAYKLFLDHNIRGIRYYPPAIVE